MPGQALQAGPGRGALLAAPPCFVKPDPVSAGWLPMNEPPRLSREEKLAAKLRENLRRRKAQARELPRELPRAISHGLPENGPDSSLPKAEPDS